MSHQKNKLRQRRRRRRDASGQRKPRPAAKGRTNAQASVDPSLNLEVLVLIMHALAFGPLGRDRLLRAFRGAGILNADGSAISAERLRSAVRRLESQGHLERRGDAWQCASGVRPEVLSMARRKGYIEPLGLGLQAACAGQHAGSGLVPHSWGGGVHSLADAQRDFLLAIEARDSAELRRLLAEYKSSGRAWMAALLSPLVAEAFDAAALDWLPAEWLGETVWTGMLWANTELKLGHPIFEYAGKLMDASTERETVAGVSRASMANLLAQRSVLAGDLLPGREILAMCPGDGSALLVATCAMLGGDLPEAKRLFALTCKPSDGKARTQEHLGSMPGMLHALLLVQSDAPAERRRADKWLGWVEGDYQNPYRVCAEFLSILLRHRTGQPVNFPADPDAAPTPLAHAVTVVMLLLMADGVREVARGAAGCPIAPKLLARLSAWPEHFAGKGAAWPAMQIASLLERLGQSCGNLPESPAAFFERTGIRDLADLWPRREAWELRLTALAKTVAVDGGGVDDQRERRLGWRLDGEPGEIYRVTPVEQKRAKRGGWTKGRQLSLAELAGWKGQTLDYLTAGDREVLASIRGEGNRDRYGWYRLDHEHVLAALAGHDNVFWITIRRSRWCARPRR